MDQATFLERTRPEEEACAALLARVRRDGLRALDHDALEELAARHRRVASSGTRARGSADGGTSRRVDPLDEPIWNDVGVDAVHVASPPHLLYCTLDSSAVAQVTPMPDPTVELALEDLAHRARVGRIAIRHAYGDDPAVFHAEAPDHPMARTFAHRIGRDPEEVVTAIETTLGKRPSPGIS